MEYLKYYILFLPIAVYLGEEEYTGNWCVFFE